MSTLRHSALLTDSFIPLKGTAQGNARAHAKATIALGLMGLAEGRPQAFGKVLRGLALKGRAQGNTRAQGKAIGRWKLRGTGQGVARAYALPNQLPRILVRREFNALLRISTHRYGVNEEYREAVWHEPLVIELPHPEEALQDDFGIAASSELEIAIADTALRAVLEAGTLDGAQAIVEVLTRSHYTTGAPQEEVITKGYTVAGYRYRSGEVTLSLADIEDVRLQATYPFRKFAASDWPELFIDHAGRPVPVAVGTAVKVPCTLIETNAGAGPFVYAVCEQGPSVLTIYRGGRIVSPTEYTAGTATAGGYTVLTVSFANEQLDFQGNHYALEADVAGSNNRNAVAELKRLLLAAGATVDPVSFTLAEAYGETAKMYVDFAHASERTYAALVRELALVARASLLRGATGEYSVIQDKAVSVIRSYDETAGDLIELTEYRSARPPQKLELSFRPNIARPGELEHTLSRSAGGYTGTERIELSMVRDAETADRAACYQALRRQHGARARASVHDARIRAGQAIAVKSGGIYSGSKTWIAERVRFGAAGDEVELRQYADAIHVYTPGTLPANATTGYSPDFSQTPPAAPGGLIITANVTSLNQDGTAQCALTVKATPPATNWTEIWFMAENQVTNEIYLGQGEAIGGGEYGTTLAGLRPNTLHNLFAWAVNGFGLKGEVTAPVPFTSQSWTSAPAAPTGVAVTQATGKVLRLKWNPVAGSNIDHFNVFRKVGAGNFSKVGEEAATVYVDNDVNYGTSYSYKLRTVDRAGNESDDSATVSRTPSVNVGTPDIVSNAISSVVGQNDNQAQVLTTSYQDLASVQITTEGGRVLVDWGTSYSLEIPADGSTTFAWLHLRLKRGSTVLVDETQAAYLQFTGGVGANSRSAGGTYSDTYFDTPSAGTHTYTIQGKKLTGSGPVFSYRRSLQVVELKR